MITKIQNNNLHAENQVLHKKQKAIRVISTIIGILSLLWGLVFAVFSLVDPVAPVYFIFFVPFVLLSLVLGHKGWLVLKLYGVLFVISLFVAFWTVDDLEGKVTLVNSLDPFNEDIFIKCSEAMFKNLKDEKKQLTLQQQADFDICMNQ